MSKPATIWRNQNGTDTLTDDNSGFSLLLETGFSLLLEAGFDLLLEDAVMTPKHPSEWSSAAKVRSSWEARDGYSSVTTGTGDTRYTEVSDTRITETGDTRITEPATFTDKPRTEWTE